MANDAVGQEKIKRLWAGITKGSIKLCDLGCELDMESGELVVIEEQGYGFIVESKLVGGVFKVSQVEIVYPTVDNSYIKMLFAEGMQGRLCVRATFTDFQAERLQYQPDIDVPKQTMAGEFIVDALGSDDLKKAFHFNGIGKYTNVSGACHEETMHYFTGDKEKKVRAAMDGLARIAEMVAETTQAGDGKDFALSGQNMMRG